MKRQRTVNSHPGERTSFAEGTDRDQGSEAAPRLRFLGGALTILMAALVAIVPQLIRGNSCGHDFDVHLVSWLDCANAWRHGILYPHWAPSPNYGAGEPRFVYYPPLTWMLGAALSLALPWRFVPIALTFLTFAATGLATRALALEALDDMPATLAGCAAIFSGFTLFTGYERAAFPEFAGGFWLPLVVLFVMREGAGSATARPFATGAKGWGAVASSGLRAWRRALDGSTAGLAVALAGAWFSNLPLGVIAGYLMMGVALLWALVRRSWTPLVRAGLAALLGLGLAAIYWLPAALERTWVDIRQATEDPGYNFENNWIFKRNANPLLALHDQILAQVSWIAVSMIAVAAAAIAVAWLRGKLPKGKASALPLWWVPLAAIPVVVLFFLFPVSRPLWHLLPEMAFLQYPWRWLEAVEAPLAIFFAAAVWPRGRRARAAVLALCAAAFLAATVYAGRVFFQVCAPEDSVSAVVADTRSGAGAEGMYEYEPPGGDDSSVATGLPDGCLVSDPAAVLGKAEGGDPDANPSWSPDEGSCRATFQFAGGLAGNPERRAMRGVAPASGYLVLRLMSFPAWMVRLNGQALTGDRAAAFIRRADGLIEVPVAQGPVDLTVDWTTTPDVWAGRWVSLLSMFLLAGLWWRERRNRRSGLT